VAAKKVQIFSLSLLLPSLARWPKLALFSFDGTVSTAVVIKHFMFHKIKFFPLTRLGALLCIKMV
jgi:hypothetical protein